jgi:molybdopterin/thiamine biosynthesis adenylyltransferase
MIGGAGMDERFSRLQAIPWWDQGRLAAARVLVIGAGALGNEVLKNLALLGVGRIAVVDRDTVERSNLSRSVLFRESDEGRPKAERAAAAVKGLAPSSRVQPVVADVLAEVGLGLFRWADVVVGAVDNREARVFVNAACARTGRPWFDGGIEVLQGLARGFAPPGTACYECTMTARDWQLVEQRRSCAFLARRAVAARGTPTTPTTASVVAALQVQEVVKLLHGLPSLLGRGVFFDGLAHESYAVAYPLKPDCPWHDPPAEIVPLPLTSEDPLHAVRDAARERLGHVESLELSREIVASLHCSSCDVEESVMRAPEHVDESRAVCPQCEKPRAPRFLHTLTGDDELLARTAAQIGLPRWDVVWARRGDDTIGFELAGDAARALGPAGGDEGER